MTIASMRCSPIHRTAAHVSIPTRSCAVASSNSTKRTLPLAARSIHSSSSAHHTTSRRRPQLSLALQTRSQRIRCFESGPSAFPSKGPTARYDELVKDKVLKSDDHQRSIIAMLQSLHDELKSYSHKTPDKPLGPPVEAHKGFFARLFGGGKSSSTDQDENHHASPTMPTDVPKGLYLFGDVGTGKSMLMDLFYDTLPPNITHKRRIHFHQFMIDAHKRMHAFKKLTHRPSGIVVGASSAVMSGLAHTVASVAPSVGDSAKDRLAAAHSSLEEVDPIPHVALEFAKEATVLCFDEFQVTDIADAMILRRLLEHMLAHGVVCVMTSNRHPNDLYKNGIQRRSFIPCIELLKTQLVVKDLNSGTDYRKIPRALSKVYFSPMDHNNLMEFEKLFHAFTDGNPKDPIVENRTLTIWGRKIKVPQSTSKVARFTFQELCGTPRSAADYIEITRNFGTLFIDAIPKMGLDQRETARRFITFIDAAYESKTKLFLTSEVPILEVFLSDEEVGKKGAAATSDAMREAMDALGLNMDLKSSPIFSGQEELFAFARVISRLTEMQSQAYAEMARSQ